MSRRQILVFLVVFSFALNGFAQQKSRPKQVLPFKASEKTLANGLKVIVVPTGFPNLVSIQIPVQTGSRNEVEAGKTGFAHFFEHMMFRGTKSFSPEAYQKILSAAGASQNAYTTDDYTNYHTTFAKEDLETMLKIEADRFMNLSYGIEAFKTEARAVLGEYNKNSANPTSKIDEVRRDKAFMTHTYKHTTMGFVKDVEDMPNQFEYSKVFFDRWYRPENTTIIVAGDVSAPEVFRLVDKYWSQWKRGNYKVNIPKEPEPKASVYAHVPWTSDTLPWVAVSFHGPAFSETNKEYAAISLLLDLYFGETSEIYKRLVEKEQKLDALSPETSRNLDPSLVGVWARVKALGDAVYVRDELLKVFAEARSRPVSEKRLADAKSNERYSFIARLDNTDSIAGTLARYVRYRRSYDTLNQLFGVFESLKPADLQAAAQKYFTDNRLVVTTLSKEQMPQGIEKAPLLSELEASDVKIILAKSALSQLNVKAQFTVGSAMDPKGKEGLAVLAAMMISDGGSKAMQVNEINQALYPIAGRFGGEVDKEMTTFTASINKDNWKTFVDIVMPRLLDPGMREDDFRRLKDKLLSALKEDLRSNNEEELAKEALQAAIFEGTPYGHPSLGTVSGISAITIDDVRSFMSENYTKANLVVGVAGDASDDVLQRLQADLGMLPAGTKQGTREKIVGRRPQGIEVEIIAKDTRATAISFGHPIEVTRSHPDFTALLLARTWLGEHRSSASHLFQRIREVRGMNYGDYAYIEAFPGGMFVTTPGPNVARRAQIFEVWIRPVVPANAHMALRIAIHELEKLIEGGLTEEEFERTRDYLMKNVFLMTSTQDHQLGYALDSKWYGTGEYTSFMREQLQKLTRDDVNRAIKRHLSSKDLQVVAVTKDAQALKAQLVSDAFSAIKYDADKPAELLDEDKVIGARKLNIRADGVKIVPVDQVFAK